MFSAAEMQLIRSHHAADYESLLRDLSIPIPDWESDDELRVYDEIDDKLTKKLFGLMKSPTLYDGYTKLLKLGGVPYDYSETFNQMLGMVVANREKILRGLEKQHDDYNKPEPEPEVEEHFEIEVTELKQYKKQTLDFGTAWKTLKKSISEKLGSQKGHSYQVVCSGINEYIDKTEKNNSLFELSDDKRSFHSFDDFARAYSTGDNYAVQLKITKKTIERRGKQNSTLELPEFTVPEMEHVLNILERVDDIVKKI